MSVVAFHYLYSSQAAHVHAHPILPGKPIKSKCSFSRKQAIYFTLEQLLSRKSVVTGKKIVTGKLKNAPLAPLDQYPVEVQV